LADTVNRKGTRAQGKFSLSAKQPVLKVNFQEFHFFMFFLTVIKSKRLREIFASSRLSGKKTFLLGVPTEIIMEDTESIFQPGTFHKFHKLN
jgi:hypothetical protein